MFNVRPININGIENLKKSVAVERVSFGDQQDVWCAHVSEWPVKVSSMKSLASNRNPLGESPKTQACVEKLIEDEKR